MRCCPARCSAMTADRAQLGRPLGGCSPSTTAWRICSAPSIPGLRGTQVAHLKHLGVLTRPRIGWYATQPSPPPAGERLLVGGVLGCTSAAASWGIVVPEHAERRLQVSLAPGTTRLRRSDDPTGRAWAYHEPDVRWHWDLRADSVAGWRVSPLDAILQLAACVEWRWLVAAIDSARCPAQRAPLLTEADARPRCSLPAHLRSAVDRSDPKWRPAARRWSGSLRRTPASVSSRTSG